MKRTKFFILTACILAAIALLSFSSPTYADRSLPPLVSTGWLADNSGMEDLVIVDIRTAGEYEAGHIANAINIPFEVPFSAWITMKDDLLLEVPEKRDLFDMLGAYGIRKHSQVIVVTSGAAQPPYPLANATRVAATLLYAGVKNVSILDGGYDRWAGEGRPTTTDVPAINPTDYKGDLDKKMFITIDKMIEVIDKPQKWVLVDARDAEVYDGTVVEPWTGGKAGHIPTAKSLPTPWMWNEDGTYKSEEALREMAEAIVGGDKGQKIAVYCGVGGYASSWWYVMTEVLGYKNVQIYDGAAQEWAKYFDLVVD